MRQALFSPYREILQEESKVEKVLIRGKVYSTIFIIGSGDAYG
jgi:hypothetical protein